MTALVNAIDRKLVIEKGFRPGTTLENRVTLMLTRFNVPTFEQQFRVGRYKLDYAWPSILIGLEADGWFHRSGDQALRDASRDAWPTLEGLDRPAR